MSDKFRCFLLVFSFALIFHFDTDFCFVVFFSLIRRNLCLCFGRSAWGRPMCNMVLTDEKEKSMCSTRCSRGAGNVTRQKTQHIWNKIFGAFFHWKPKRWRRRSMVNRILIWSEGNACNKNNKKQTKHENRPIKNIIKSKLTKEREGEESTNAKWQSTTSTHSSARRFFLFLIFFFGHFYGILSALMHAISSLCPMKHKTNVKIS